MVDGVAAEGSAARTLWRRGVGARQGPEAAAVTALAHYTLRTAAARSVSPARVESWVCSTQRCCSGARATSRRGAEELGVDGLRQLVGTVTCGSSAAYMAASIEAHLSEYRDGLPLDDTAILVAQVPELPKWRDLT